MPAAHNASPPEPRTVWLYLAGLGCRRGCSAHELRQLLEDSLQVRGLSSADLHALASLDGKLNEPGLETLAEQLGLALHGVALERLQGYESRLTDLSEATLRATGCAGVAEASALAVAEALGAPSAELLITKQRSANATFALARTKFLPTSENA
ncbi:cobalt-precorrin 5A hydrolase [Geopseudomonas sagittaria]|uniref:Cobalt-precorrin 5A hydrolase n=1 Tax=Geopseudomonas sagittaria TaxID=1135990 RepID=A0A1I5X7F7_9GAMM|nr:cobalamin biosynthesis protein [Pseudomonas sagittaria]MCM2329730.1 cobalamin biosynthesis protein [Pseudomonas sagittaria]SFQ27929.1 cobalt-precorrin 5A hydrolase [Pseudomonas sagittaria]